MILSLGPYAAALSYIIGNANKSRIKADRQLKKDQENLIVYRGIYMKKEDFKSQFFSEENESSIKKDWTSQRGFCCCSRDKSVALMYVRKELDKALDDSKVGVLL